MPATHVGVEPSPGADPGLCLTGAGSQPCATAGTGASDGGPFRFTEHRFSVLTPVLGVLGAIRTHTAQYLMPVPVPPAVGCEDMEPPPGADPGHPPYEGEAAAVRGGVSCPARIRTSIA
jgi:hypothetical protein